MNSIQKYVLNSLFARNQITEEKLAQALDTFSNESAIDTFLSVLITGTIDTVETMIHITGEMQARLHVIKIIKEIFGLDLKTAKDIVDVYLKGDNLIFPARLLYENRTFTLNAERIKTKFFNYGYTFSIYNKSQ